MLYLIFYFASLVFQNDTKEKLHAVWYRAHSNPVNNKLYDELIFFRNGILELPYPGDTVFLKGYEVKHGYLFVIKEGSSTIEDSSKIIKLTHDSLVLSNFLCHRTIQRYYRSNVKFQ